MAPVFLLLLPILVSILCTLPHWPTVEAVKQSEQLGQSLSSTIINNSGAEEEAIYHPPLSVNGGGEAMDKNQLSASEERGRLRELTIEQLELAKSRLLQLQEKMDRTQELIHAPIQLTNGERAVWEAIKESFSRLVLLISSQQQHHENMVRTHERLSLLEDRMWGRTPTPTKAPSRQGATIAET